MNRFALAIVLAWGLSFAGCGRNALHAVHPNLAVCADEADQSCASPLWLGEYMAKDAQAHSVLVRNTSNGTLHISAIVVVKGSGISLGTLPQSVDPFGSAPLPLQLTAELGDNSVVVAFDSDDPETPYLEVELQFRGLPCEEGSTRACGSDVGRCTPGIAHCSAGVWGDCTGGVGPTSEICDGEDDDCNGSVDDGELCDDGVFCNGSEVCYQGACVVADVPGCADPALYPDLNGPCSVGVCDEATQQCTLQQRPDSTPCDDGSFCNTGEACLAGSCTGGAPVDCTAWDDLCNQGVCDEGLRRCQQQAKPTCSCDPGIDADFDGANQCDDCDDRNGAVYPGAPELCNGVDDDCDGKVDEDFDVDTDNYSVCARDPQLYDCDDANPNVNPGAPEICDDGAGGQTGNGIDDDCDGYVDEGCQPCDPVDTDGDGVSECDGDCAPSDPQRFPGNQEVCDGKDSDCNIFTVENCDVSDTCNHDGDGDFTNDPDQCRDDLLCACIVNQAGSCSGNYQCTSYCNSSHTGPVGDGCKTNEACRLDLLRSANVHGCDVVPTALGSKVGGEACGGDAECRSGTCARLFVGSGTKDYCLDYCSSDAYCPAAATVCRLRRAESFDGRCWPVGRLGTQLTGSSCSADTDCDHGLCITDGASRYCSEPCCTDGDCTSGFTCSLEGDEVATNYVVPESGTSCAVTTDCPTGMVCYTTTGECAWRLAETSPMCMKDASGQGSRRAGAACTSGNDCMSGFCSAATSTCLEVCCDDSTCPVGLTCELQTVQAQGALVTQARVCVNLSTDAVLLRK